MKTKHPQAGPVMVPVIECIESLSNGLKENGLSDRYTPQTEEELKQLGQFLDCSRSESILFAVLFTLCFRSEGASVDDVAEFLETSPVRIIREHESFMSLVAKGYIRGYRDSNPFRNRSLGSSRYYVPFTVLNPILNNIRPAKAVTSNLSMPDLMDCISGLLDDLKEDEIYHSEFVSEATLLLKQNRHIPGALFVRSLDIVEAELMLLLCLMVRTYNGEPESELQEMLNLLFTSQRQRYRLRTDIMRGNARLIQRNIMKTTDASFRSETHLMLTAEGIESIFGEEAEMLQRKELKHSSMVSSSDIRERKLFFNAAEEAEIMSLGALLQQQHYSGIVSRLRAEGMPEGFCILFHGQPGTGKTEAAMQLARMTGRAIIPVSISETKSMWFGESEKLIKKLFDRYRMLVESMDVAPILLFNEADGVLGRRKSNGESAVMQTENAIQNIILQEMEQLKGILIATTNMTQNLDDAFSRRFLYRIHFSEPDAVVRYSIWRDRLPAMPEAVLQQLASYPLCGGNIDNVVRKYTVTNILRGQAGTEELFELCKAEGVKDKGQSIGFRSGEGKGMRFAPGLQN